MYTDPGLLQVACTQCQNDEYFEEGSFINDHLIKEVWRFLCAACVGELEEHNKRRESPVKVREAGCVLKEVQAKQADRKSLREQFLARAELVKEEIDNWPQWKKELVEEWIEANDEE